MTELGDYLRHEDADRRARAAVRHEKDLEIARAIIALAESGTQRIRDLGGDCDDASRTYEPILAQLGLPNPRAA